MLIRTVKEDGISTIQVKTLDGQGLPTFFGIGLIGFFGSSG